VSSDTEIYLLDGTFNALAGAPGHQAVGTLNRTSSTRTKLTPVALADKSTF